MFLHRLITAVFLLIAVFLIFFGIPGVFDTPKVVFISIAWILCLLAIYELTTIYQFDIVNQIGVMALVSVLLYALYFTPHDVSQTIIAIAAITWSLVIPLVLMFKPRKFSKISIIFFTLIIFVPAFYSLIFLHSLLGSVQLISIIAVAWVADTGAYLVGRRIGRHKLAPAISPGKSIEGALGAILAVVLYLAMLKYFNLVIYLTNYASVIKFAIILTVVSILGDLIESWFKRVAHVKDSGNWLPGHGGILDRIDSLMAVLPIAFILIYGNM